MKKFVIGDVHGNYEELMDLLDKINPNLRQDKLIYLGDYIDRGPQSYKVIRFLIDLQNKYGKEHVVLLRGNHEDMAIENIEHGRIDCFNGYDITFMDFIKNNDSIENYYEFFKGLPLYYEDESFIYVHGGIKPGIAMEKQDDYDLLWIREEFFESSLTFIKPVIFGHTPTINIIGTFSPFIKKDRIGIDTGIVYGGRLTALEIHDGKIVNIHNVKKIAA
ncbi:MAG: serine/threonine protein phosphatase [Sedimentibacter sp.]|jgi:serine/threonine protein phosphatase 1|nr:serine/threonine protein phosphatase [Sedimentibacter sp.]